MSELYDGFGNKTELSKDVSRLKDDIAHIIEKPTDYGLVSGYLVSKISGNANLSSEYDNVTNILTIIKNSEVNVFCNTVVTTHKALKN